MASPVQDKLGNLYGTAAGSSLGGGTVFEVTRAGVEKTLYRFSGGADGDFPSAELVRDKTGNLYGTTLDGGAFGHGTVFRLSSLGVEKVLWSFTGGLDGWAPYGGLVLDAKGNVYGTTAFGGASVRGVVFEVTPAGSERVIYSFSGGSDGAAPVSALVHDSKGNLYGTASQGGNPACSMGCGTVFEVTPTGTLTILHSFSGSDGYHPEDALVRDANGNLYGTTASGGSQNEGTVFKVTAKGVGKVLYNFASSGDGVWPQSGLVRDTKGNLYGTTRFGGHSFPGFGTIYRLTPH